MEKALSIESEGGPKSKIQAL